MRRSFRSVILFGLLLSLAVAHKTEGGGPLYLSNDTPIVWPNDSFPVTYNVDPGNLGPFSYADAAAVIDQAFSQWGAVETSVLHFRRGADLPEDVNVNNYPRYMDSNLPGQNPVIFDDDGAIIKDLYGVGAQNDYLGYAGLVTSIDTRIIAVQMVFNGYSLRQNQVNRPALLSTVLHEIGHFCGLDHAQFLRHLAYDGVGNNDTWVPIMLPTAADDDSFRTRLTEDDRASLSLLYPNTAFTRQRGAITGKVIRNDRELPGINVIARRVDSPTQWIYSTVSGTFALNRGTYQLKGLPPGAYQLRIEPIDPAFTEASSVGPYAETVSGLSFNNPPPSQMYGGNLSSPLGRSAWTPVTVSAGATAAGIDFSVGPNASPAEETDTQLLGLNSSETGAVPTYGISAFQYLLVPSGNENRVAVTVRTSNPAASFEVVIRKNKRVATTDNATVAGVKGTAKIVWGANGDLPLEPQRYFIAVRNLSSSDLSFEIQSEILSSPTATPTRPQPTPTSVTPKKTPTPTPTVRPTVTPTPSPTPTAVEVNPLLGFVALDEIGGTYPRGAAVHNFDVGISDATGILLLPGVFDGLPDPVAFAPLLYFNGNFYPIAKTIKFTGEIDPNGNGSEGVYYLNGGNLGNFPPVIGRLGATGGPNRGGIDADNDPANNLHFGNFSGDLIPALPDFSSGDTLPSFVTPLVDLEPAGNNGFYVLGRNGRIYAEGNALEALDRASPPPNFNPNVPTVDLEIFRGRKVSLAGSRYSEDLIGTGAYILDRQGIIYVLGNAPALVPNSLAVILQVSAFSYHSLKLIPNPEGAEFIGLGVLRGDGLIFFVPFLDTKMTPDLEAYIRFLNPFGQLPSGFSFDIARGFEVEISDNPIYGKNERGETVASKGRRIGIFLFDGFGGVHTGGRSTRYSPAFGYTGDDTRIINGIPTVPFPVNVPYFGVDVMKALAIAPPVRRATAAP